MLDVPENLDFAFDLAPALFAAFFSLFVLDSASLDELDGDLFPELLVDAEFDLRSRDSEKIRHDFLRTN
jgi:hypothetical protein